MVLLAVISRLIPHPPNIAPITGLALFSGARLNKKAGFIIPISAMVLSDIFLGFHQTIPFVYGSFILISFIGSFFLKKNGALQLLLVSLFSSVLFFVVTNFGVWATSGMYIKDINGLLTTYIMGLPFFKNTLFGDLFYSIFFFYGFELSLLSSEKLAQYFKK